MRRSVFAVVESETSSVFELVLLALDEISSSKHDVTAILSTASIDGVHSGFINQDTD